MLNIEVNRSAEGVERYFERELTVSDYWMKEPGIWAGRGAERLGLRGPVERSQFVAWLQLQRNVRLRDWPRPAASSARLPLASAFFGGTRLAESPAMSLPGRSPKPRSSGRWIRLCLIPHGGLPAMLPRAPPHPSPESRQPVALECFPGYIISLRSGSQ
jgi:hypothetical protein